MTSISGYQPTELKQNEPIKETLTDFCFVYLMHDISNNYYKIGISNNPEYRERTLQSEKPTIEMIASKKFPIRKIADSIEKALHNTYSEKRLRGEWFELNAKDVEYIKETLK
ncbi:GIY-YIG nuclease family protein [Mariniflexile ostreae]|uniref:GIY-YIG nuclease family protein n=1 Tax=Mariniflexile ostreae TaxID=1520892 RepID=A0ABV5FEC5_9FLAO